MIRAGTSLVDTMLGSILLVAVYAFTASSVATTIGATSRAMEEAALLSELGRLESVVTAACARIDQPVDLPAPEAEMESASFVIRHLDGDATRSLVLRWDDGGIFVGGLEEPHRFPRLVPTSVGIVNDPVPILYVTVAHRGREWTVVAPFGALPRPSAFHHR